MGVLVAGVFLKRLSGEKALAPQLNGQWGPIGPAIRPPLGDALLVLRQPRDRMGFRTLARQYARHQLERHVHRIGRSFVDWGGFYGSFGFGPARESRLFGEAHRAGAGHGRRCDAFRRAARATLSTSTGFS